MGVVFVKILCLFRFVEVCDYCDHFLILSLESFSVYYHFVGVLMFFVLFDSLSFNKGTHAVLPTPMLSLDSKQSMYVAPLIPHDERNLSRLIFTGCSTNTK